MKLLGDRAVKSPSKAHRNLVLVVQKLDSAIQWISNSEITCVLSLFRDLSSGKHYPSFEPQRPGRFVKFYL